MVSILSGLLPDPKGAEPRVNRLMPGSIPLRTQMQLCMKYVGTADQPLIFSLFWSKYRDSNYLDEYLTAVVEQMPNGYVRARAMSDYYGNLCKDFQAITRLLNSDAFPNLKAMEGSKPDPNSDYAGAANGVKASIIDLIERGVATGDDVVAIVESSRLGEATKAEMIRSIKKRSAEVNYLRGRAERNNEK